MTRMLKAFTKGLHRTMAICRRGLSGLGAYLGQRIAGVTALIGLMLIAWGMWRLWSLEAAAIVVGLVFLADASWYEFRRMRRARP